MNKRLILSLILFVFFETTSFAQTPENCLDQAFSALGIESNLKSDPALIRNVLAEDMFLADLPRVRKALGSKLKKPASMSDMITKIKLGIKSKHPAIVEFLCVAHERNLLEKTDTTRFFHHMFILEDIISAMAKDWKLMEDVHTAFLEKRASYDIRDSVVGSLIDIYNAGGGLFGAIKAVTMDGTMNMYTDMRKRGSITEEEIEARKSGLHLNIMEAYATDRVHGHKENAYAGLALAAISPETLMLSGPNRRIKYVYDQEWASLYETWNLAFIIGNLKNMDILLPKLLIPAVLDAKAHDYLFNRALALWTSLNFVLFAKLEGRPDFELPHAEEIATLWGEINYRYAQSYISKHASENWSAYFLEKKMHLDDTLDSLVDELSQPE